jgi:aminomethyltransferase
VADGPIASPLEDRHRALGAKLAPFAGWEMPIDFGSVVAEHTAVRQHAGVFDLSHLGSVSVTGPEAAAVAQRALSNDIERIGEGGAQYSLCLTPDGGILDDLIVYRMPWGMWTVPNAASNADVVAALRACAQGRSAAVTDHGAAVTCLAVQGPESAGVLRQAGVEPGDLAFMTCRDLEGHGVGDAAGAPPPRGGLLARTGYTGERGYELFLPAEQAPAVWDRVRTAEAHPVGLGARDTLRLEMGLPLHGNDLSPDTSPVAARLMWAVRLGTGFVGEDAVAAVQQRGVSRRLIGLWATGRGVPRAQCPVSRAGHAVGELTSGGYSPTLGTGLGLGYLDADVEPGAGVDIDVRGRTLPAEVAKPPFVDRSPKS